MKKEIKQLRIIMITTATLWSTLLIIANLVIRHLYELQAVPYLYMNILGLLMINGVLAYAYSVEKHDIECVHKPLTDYTNEVIK